MAFRRYSPPWFRYSLRLNLCQNGEEEEVHGLINLEAGGEKNVPIGLLIVNLAFLAFLLVFWYAVFRWSLADARSRGKSAWPLAALTAVLPLVAYVLRISFRPYVTRSFAMSLMFGVPLLAWAVWLLIRPPVQRPSADSILCGREGASSRWILIVTLIAAVNCMAGGWLGQFVIYPLYLAVPPASFPAYYGQYNEAIVFSVIVPYALGWALSVVLIWYRPRVVPAWACWSVVGLAVLGFVASAAFEFPHNQELIEHGYNAAALRAKITGNWFRVVPWTLEVALLAWMTNLTMNATHPDARPSD